MAHFAQLDENNIVKQIIVISNDDIKDDDGNESEELGIDLCKNIINDPNSVWKQTSYNSNFRNKYAGIENLYLEEFDDFVDPKPYNSWIFNTTTLEWDPPIPYPENYSEYTHRWNESNLEWEIIPT